MDLFTDLVGAGYLLIEDSLDNHTNTYFSIKCCLDAVNCGLCITTDINISLAYPEIPCLYIVYMLRLIDNWHFIENCIYKCYDEKENKNKCLKSCMICYPKIAPWCI